MKNKKVAAAAVLISLIPLLSVTAAQAVKKTNILTN
jgi:hypothetical protein